MIGKDDLYHNTRSFIAENVDRTRVADNITIIKDDIRQVYHELFDKALTRLLFAAVSGIVPAEAHFLAAVGTEHQSVLYQKILCLFQHSLCSG